jgi:hypothetical protein
LELLIVTGALCLLSVLAHLYGYDSRRPGESGSWWAWREASRGSASPRTLVDASGLDMEARHRVAELRSFAAIGRLTAPPRPTSAVPAVHRVVLTRLGAALVWLGQRLQAYGRAPTLAPR